MKPIIISAGWVVLTFACIARAQTYTTVDYPGASQTWLGQINDLGQAVGYAVDASGHRQGFLYEVGVGFTPLSLNFPDAVQLYVLSINNFGDIVGMYSDSGSSMHSFLRNSTGAITPIVYPGAIDTHLTAIDDAGRIVGFFGVNYPPNGWYETHGYIRNNNGTFTRIDFPSAVETTLKGIDSLGEIFGAYGNGDPARTHGFLLDTKGAFTAVDFPGALSTVLHASFNGAIIGSYSFNPVLGDPYHALHSFLLSKESAFTTIDPPGATYSTPGGVNSRGQLTGTYWDASGGIHGYLTVITPPTAVFAHEAVGGYSTLFSLANTGSDALTGNLTLTRADGTPMIVTLSSLSASGISALIRRGREPWKVFPLWEKGPLFHLAQPLAATKYWRILDGARYQRSALSLRTSTVTSATSRAKLLCKMQRSHG